MQIIIVIDAIEQLHLGSFCKKNRRRRRCIPRGQEQQHPHTKNDFFAVVVF